MPDPSLVPDEALLRRFLLGELSGSELESVASYLDQHPEVAATLNALKVRDTLLDSLKTGETRDDSPRLAELIARLKGLPAKKDANSTDSPEATGGETVTAARKNAASALETRDQDAHTESEDDVLAMLAPSEHPGDLGRLGRYRVLRVLGRGGMGVVFEAEDDKLKRHVALKATLPAMAANASARKRFIREAETAAKVEHDNIVPIYDIADANGVPFLAMPLLVGEPLDEPLKPGQPLPLADVLAIGRQVAEGLAAAHAAGLIHRDIKPSNVWLERTAKGAFKRARILDFGLARSLRDSAGLTHSGAVMGTPAYMAPEQARGQVVDHRADLFSLGCVLYQMTTGLRPFQGDDTLAVLTALATDTPPAPIEVNPTLPPALSALIERLLTKNPANRWPPTAQEVADELARIAVPQPVVVALPVPKSPAARAEDVWVEATAPTVPAGGVPLAASAEPEADPPARRRGGRGPLFLAIAVLLGTLGLVGALYGGTVIRIATNKGELVIEVDDPNIEVKVVRGDAVLVDRTKGREFVIKAGDGEVIFYDPVTEVTTVAKKFELKRGKEVRVKATMAELAEARPQPKPGPSDPRGPLPGDADRKATLMTAAERKSLEWVFSVGGKVEVLQRTGVWITDPKQLPTEPFILSNINLDGIKSVDDTALENLRDIAPVRWGLNLSGTTVTDAGVEKLVTFPGFKEINSLDLNYLPVTGKGLAHLAKFSNLCHVTLIGCVNVNDDALGKLKDVKLQLLALNLSETITDAGMDHIAKQTALRGLNLNNTTKITDAGIKKLTPLTLLESLNVGGKGVTNASLATIVQFRELKHLGLLSTSVTDAGLAQLSVLPKLTALGLEGTDVMDVGLAHLLKCPNLSEVNLDRTKVTAAGAKKLAATRPHWRIDHLSGLIEPSATGKPVDLLALINDKRDLVSGRWGLSGGILYGGGPTAVDPWTEKFQIPYVPQGEYDLVAVVQRAGFAKNAFPPVPSFALTLTGPYRCQVILDWHSEGKVLNGIQVIDGKIFLENQTRTEGDFFGPTGGPVVITCRVRKDGITVLTDGQERFKWKGDTSKLSHDEVFWKLPDKTRLAVAVQNAEYRINEWRLYPVEGAPASPGPAPFTAEQREALEWVLAHGQLELTLPGGKDIHVRRGTKLPDGPFAIRSVHLTDDDAINDSALDNLKAFPAFPGYLFLARTQITDAGLKKLGTFPIATAVNRLFLNALPITDDGLAHLAAFPVVDNIHLNGCKITGEGFRHLKALPRLTTLNLNDCPALTDAGIAHLKGVTWLHTIQMANAPITATGLAHLGGCANLRDLDIRGVKVSKSAVDALRAARPFCKVEWDGEQMPPDNAFPGEVVLREPFDKVSADVVGISGPQATVQSKGGVLEVRWPAAAERRVPTTYFYTYGPPMENIAFSVRFRTHGNASYGLTFRNLDTGNGHSSLSLHVRPGGAWTLTRWGTESKNGKLEVLEPVVLKESTAPEADLAANKWVVLAVSSTGATTEIHLNGRHVASVTEAQAPTGKALAHKGALDFGISLMDGNAAGLDLDYVVVWKLPPSAAELRKSVEWVMKNGGQVRVVQAAGKDYKLQKPEEIDKFLNSRLKIDLYSGVTDDNIENLKGITHCEHLQIRSGTFADAGMKKLAALPFAKGLHELRLVDVPVTNAGLEALSECKSLVFLHSIKTKITIVGAEKLAKALPKCKIEYESGIIVPKEPKEPKEPKNPTDEEQRESLRAVCRLGGTVSLRSGSITDAEKVPPGPYLTDAIIIAFSKGSVLTPADIDALAALPVTVSTLFLPECTDEVLARLAAVRGLRYIKTLDLASKSVTEAGLEHLTAFKQLEALNLTYNATTGSGLKHLRALPKLTRLALGSLPTREGAAELKELKITGLSLHSCPVGDEALIEIAEITTLRVLSLSWTKVSDAGITPLKRLVELTELNVGFGVIGPSEVTDKSMDVLAGLPNLRAIQIHNAKVTNDGLAKLKAIKKLEKLVLEKVLVTDDGIAHLKEMPSLRNLTLSHLPRVTDEGLDYLAAYPNLSYVSLSGTGCTKAGLEKLAKALPKCTVLHNGTTLKPN